MSNGSSIIFLSFSIFGGQIIWRATFRALRWWGNSVPSRPNRS
jgi:hypothetical protein